MGRRHWSWKEWGRASLIQRLRLLWARYCVMIVTAGLALLLVGLWWSWSWLHENSEEIRNLAISAGVATAIFGGYVAYRHSKTDRIRAETDSRRHVAETFEGAVQLLAHKNPSVRLGAIYALEDIARQNRDKHWPIMEILTAYVREKSAPMMARLHTEPEGALPPSDEPLPPSPTDLQAVFTVLGRRQLRHEQGAGRRLNLIGAYLVEARPDPGAARAFGRARLSGSCLIGADLRAADLREADLPGADLQGADLFCADLFHADLRGANLQNGDLQGADLQLANLSRTTLHRADLRDANLRDAGLNEAKLQGAVVSGADLSTALGLTQDQLNSAHGDADTKIPEGLTRPEHWTR